MKPNKTQAVLYMYEILLRTGIICKNDVLAEFPISEMTFKRYISEIRAYLDNFQKRQVLLYKKTDNLYHLKSERDC